MEKYALSRVSAASEKVLPLYDRALRVFVELRLLDGGLAGRELELHGVFARAGDVRHRLPFEARDLVHLEVGVVHGIERSGVVPRQVLFKGGVEIAVYPVRARAPAVALRVLERFVREGAGKQHEHCKQCETAHRFFHGKQLSPICSLKQLNSSSRRLLKRTSAAA